MIIVDSNEPKKIRDIFDEHSVEYSVEPLNEGDYLVDDFLVERKEWGDFYHRLTRRENDIFMQLMRVKKAAEDQDLEPELLLEGNLSEVLSWREIDVSVILRAVAGIRKLGISVSPSPSLTGSAWYLGKLQSDDVKGKPGAIRDTPTVPQELMPVYLTQGFRGVGEKASRDLLAEFGSFQAIVNADIDELMEVDGIGEKTAERIRADVTQSNLDFLDEE